MLSAVLSSALHVMLHLHSVEPCLALGMCQACDQEHVSAQHHSPYLPAAVHGMYTSSMPQVSAYMCMCKPCMHENPPSTAHACLPVSSCELLAARGPVCLEVLRLQLLPQLPRQHSAHRLADKQQGASTHVILCNHTPAATCLRSDKYVLVTG